MATNAAPLSPMCFFMLTTDLVPPSTPTGLSAITNGCGTALLSWTASTDNAGGAGLKGYRIYRNGTLMKLVPPSTTSIVEEGMSPSTTYTLAVAAVDLADNESPQTSRTATIMTCPNQRPVANAGPDQIRLAGSAIVFDGSASRDQDGTILSYSWNFGDGTSATGINPTRTYASAGTFTVTLTVTDNLGLTGTDTAQVIVNQPPLASAGPSQTRGVGAPVNFDGGSSSDPDGTIASYTWRLGDGNTATGVRVSHTYASAGIYEVTLIARDNAGASAKDTTIVIIQPNEIPIADSGPNQSAVVGSELRFDGSLSRDPDGTIVSYAWQFDDGMTASGPVKLRTFANAGTYSVRLTVTDNLGASGSKTGLVTVLPALPPPTSGQFVSATNFGSTIHDYGRCVATDRSGNAFVGGSVNWRPFLAKQSPAGVTQWSLTFGGAGSGTILGVASGNDGVVYVTGNFFATLDFGGGALTSAGGPDIFVAKFSSAGLLLWSRQFGGSAIGSTPTESGTGIAVDTNNNSVVVTGIFDRTVDFGGGPLTSTSGQDLFLVKLSAAGSHLWSKRVGGVGPTIGTAVAVDGEGNLFATGRFGQTVDFGAGPVTAVGVSDMFLAKYNSAGGLLWANRYGNKTSLPSASGGTALALDRFGNPIVTGYFKFTMSFGGQTLTSAGYEDIFVAKYSGTNGAHAWSKRFGDYNADSASGVTVDVNGNVAISGWAVTPLDFGGGVLPPNPGVTVYVASFAPDGAHRWSKGIGVGSGEGGPVAADSQGRAYVTGRFSPSMSIRTGSTITTAGGSDIFLAEFVP